MRSPLPLKGLWKPYDRFLKDLRFMNQNPTLTKSESEQVYDQILQSPALTHDRDAASANSCSVRPSILVFATQGAGGQDEARIRELLQNYYPEVFLFDRSQKIRSFWRLLSHIRKRRPALVVMEGTGVAG